MSYRHGLPPVIIDPKEFGLPPRTVLEQTGSNTIAIVMQRKTRIIMADGRKIIEKARKIQKVRHEVTVALKTSAPVCSKTITFLEGEGIRLIPEKR
jgi:hypothetical protein